jgi:hypothetical protein
MSNMNVAVPQMGIAQPMVAGPAQRRINHMFLAIAN